MERIYGYYRDRVTLYSKKKGIYSVAYDVQTDEEGNKSWLDVKIDHEPTEQEVLDIIRQKKIEVIEEYDTSSAVNEFFFGGIPCWFDSTTRVKIKNGVESCKALGLDTYDMWFGSQKVSLGCDDTITLLAQLEKYAIECYNVTRQHIQNVKALTTVEDVESYDYKSGYPEKLSV